jgi:hypothetical protein
MSALGPDGPEGVDILGCTCTRIANKRMAIVVPITLHHFRACVSIFSIVALLITNFS